MTQRIFAKIFAALVLMLTVVGAVAQGLSGDVPTIDIKNGTATATPIAVIPFAFEGAGLPPDTDVTARTRPAPLSDRRCGPCSAAPGSC